MDLTLSLILEYSGMISTPCSLHLAGCSDPPISASQVPGTTGAHYHAQLVFNFFVEMGFHHVLQAGFKLLGSSDPPTLASEGAGTIGMSYCTWPDSYYLTRKIIISFRVSHLLHIILLHILHICDYIPFSFPILCVYIYIYIFSSNFFLGLGGDGGGQKMRGLEV